MKKRYLCVGLAVLLAGWLVASASQPARAESGFFSSLRQLFGPRPKRRVYRAPPVPTVPAVTFAYAHHAGKYHRFRYSHHTPYGYYAHPYRHGFAYRRKARPRPVQVRRRNNFRTVRIPVFTQRTGAPNILVYQAEGRGLPRHWPAEEYLSNFCDNAFLGFWIFHFTVLCAICEVPGQLA